MITKRQAALIDIRVKIDGVLDLQECDIIEEDGVEIARGGIHGRTIHPDEDSSKETDERLKKIIEVIHTQEVIEEFKRLKRLREANESGTGITSRT